MFIVVFEFGVVLGVRSCFYCGVVGVNGGCRVCRVVFGLHVCVCLFVCLSVCMSVCFVAVLWLMGLSGLRALFGLRRGFAVVVRVACCNCICALLCAGPRSN